MRRQSIGVAVAVVLPCAAWAGAANAQPADDVARADAAFQQAMALRSAGHDVEACPKFAESRALAPAVGVTLYLADCYERTGRTASAWREFRAAEKLARERDDKRADVAAQRAYTLEPKIDRLTVSPSASAEASGAEVRVDGAVLPSASWNAALAVDPGDHVVTFASPGQPLRTFNAHVDASATSAVVRIDDGHGEGTAAPPLATSAPAETAAPGHGDIGARWAAGGLMLAGAAGLGVGAWFVTDKTREVMPDGKLCDPRLRPGAIPAAAVAFSAGGLALISGAILYYVHRPGRTEVSLAPSVTPGGGGAVFRTTF
jgi:hypothetical protein